jgi:DNA-binding MarR family transcriptional regulator
MTKPDRAATKKATSGAAPTIKVSGDGHDPLRMWVRLVACYHLMEIRLRTELRNGFDTTLPRFDLMSQLYRYPEGLKMRDLSRLLMVTGGNITALTDRLIEEDLVQRRDDPTDRRAYAISLTPKGKKLFQKMAVQHERWVSSLLGDFDPSELQQLSTLLGQLKRDITNRSKTS